MYARPSSTVMVVDSRSCPRASIALRDVEQNALRRDEWGVRGRDLREPGRSILKDDCTIRITENDCVVKLIQNGSEHGNLFGKHPGIGLRDTHGTPGQSPAMEAPLQRCP
jgi:hypothetical protein